MLVVIAWAESDGLVRPHKARLGISPGLWPKGLDIKHPLGHHEHVTTWPKVIRRPKTLGLLSTLSVSSIHRYIGKPWRRLWESSMVNSNCLPDELHLAATVIRAPYSFNRTYIESNPFSYRL